MAKSKKNLVAKKMVISRKDGTVYEKTVWVDPNKDVKKVKFPKKYKNAATVNPKVYTGTTRLDSTKYQRGDKVYFKLKNGEVALGEFRHIIVNKRYPNGLASIRAKIDGEMKTIGRNVEDISPVFQPATPNETTFIRRSEAQDFAVGDMVQFSLRAKDPVTGEVGTREVHGTISRFVRKDDKGDLVHVKLDDGSTKERYLHNITRYNPKTETKLNEQQVIGLNKGINALAAKNAEDFELIELFSGKLKDKKGSDEKVEQIKTAISARNEKIKEYLQVLKGNKPFEELEIIEPVKDEKYKTTKKPKKEEPVITPEEAEKLANEEKMLIEEARIKGLLNAKQQAVANSLLNLKRLNGLEDFGSQLQRYRSEKGYHKNMADLIEFKEENKIPLTDSEKEYKTTPIPEIVKPVAPVEDDGSIKLNRFQQSAIVHSLKRDDGVIVTRASETSEDLKQLETLGLISKYESHAGKDYYKISDDYTFKYDIKDFEIHNFRVIKKEALTPVSRTITTMSKVMKNKDKEKANKKKIDELEEMIKKTKGLGLSEETEKKILERYEKQLAKYGKKPVEKKASPKAVTGILDDIEKIKVGHAPAQFKINQRIMESGLPEEHKAELRAKFSEAIKSANAEKNRLIKEAEREIKGSKGKKFDLGDLDKAIPVDNKIFEVLNANKMINNGSTAILPTDLYKAVISKQTNVTGQLQLLKNDNNEIVEVYIVRK